VGSAEVSDPLAAAFLPGGLELRDEAATRAAAAALARRLRPGDLVLLQGPLGAGKTAWVRGACVALGVPEDEVTSPTYTLMHTYAGRWPVVHADLYRLEGRVGPEEVGLDEELAAGEAVVFVEWPERLADPWARRTYEIELEMGAGSRRRVRIRSRER
jgi:tRNA threonylcarbamoyl adenosine modification protein YjeE